MRPSASPPPASAARQTAQSRYTTDQLYSIFNTKLADFLEDVEPIIGHLSEYTVIKSTVALMTRMSPSNNHVAFMYYVGNAYGEKLKSHDESFFIETDYTVYDEYVSTPDIISLLKRMWLNLSVQDKNAVWDHLDVLILVSEQIQTRVAS
jgi:hypothetical protein